MNSDASSRVFTFRSSGYTLGALLAGFVYMRVNRQFLVSVMLILMGVTLSCVPLIRSSLVVYAILTVNGLTSGFCDTGFNVWLIELWRSKSGPYILALWFFFSLGSTVAPLIIAPYLNSDLNSTQIMNNTAQSNSTVLSTDSSIHIPFAFSGVLIGLAGICIFISYRFLKYEAEPILDTDQNENPSDSQYQVDKIIVPKQNDKLASLTRNVHTVGMEEDIHFLYRARTYLVVVIIFTTLLITSYSAMEICHFQFLPLYLTSLKTNGTNEFTKQSATFVTSALGLSHTVIRGLAIFLSLKMKPIIFLYLDLTLMLISNSILIIFANSSPPMIWLGNILLGVAFGTFFPSIFSYVERLMHISDLVGGIFLCSSGLTSAFLPLLIGSLIEKFPGILVYSNVFLVGICIISLIGLKIYLFKYNQYAKNKILLSQFN